MASQNCRPVYFRFLFSATETAEGLYLIFNANETSATVNLPEGNWNVYINGEKAGVQALASVSDGSVEVEPVSALGLVILASGFRGTA